jgi:hypothetical protein
MYLRDISSGTVQDNRERIRFNGTVTDMKLGST